MIDEVERGVSPCLALDRMLARLARWLRLLGFDTSLRPELDSRQMGFLAAREGRIFLTRSRRAYRYFVQEGRGRVILVLADRPREQLQEVARAIPLDLALGGMESGELQQRPGRVPRCSFCNLVPDAVEPGSLVGRVPPYVLATASSFRRCGRCRRIYWDATHQRRFRDEVRRLGSKEQAIVRDEG